MALKVVLPDPPFFNTRLIEQLCRDQDVELVIYRDLALDAKQLQTRIEDADIIIVDVLSTYNEESLADCSKLRYLISASVGLNHIDLAYCKKHNISVSNFTHYNSRAVAEMAFANLTSLLRHVPYANLTVRSSLWLTDYFEGEELSGKKLGIVGAGNIGQELIKIGLGFDMDILCTTKHPSQARADSLKIKQFYSLEEVLQRSDFIILAATSNDETDKLINASSLKLIPSKSYVINVARSSLVDVEAMATALYEKRLAGAALDFVGTEPYSLYNDNLLIQEMVNRPNVIITPHIGFNTKEAMVRLASNVRERLTTILSTAP